MSLRRRVLLGVVLVTMMLLAADAVVAATFRSFLLGRVDSQLEQAAGPVARGFVFRGVFRRGLGGAAGPEAQNRTNRAITEFSIAVVAKDGTVETPVVPGLRENEAPPVVRVRTARTHATDIGDPLAPYTLQASGNHGAYRGVAIAVPDGRTVVIAISLREMSATFRRMLIVELLATLLVVIAQIAVALWVLRLGVRPLAAMADTAQAIAEGDLSQRVAHADDRTEAGQLGLALNAMLEQIEDAFRQRGESEDRLRRFVADASHELRTPLTSIRGYAELWRQGGLGTDDELAGAMRRMEQEAARMGVLVDDLLLLARLDQGRPLDFVPVDLTAVVADAVRDARAVEPDRPIDLAAQAVTVNGDEHRLRQLVTNLLANARMHTPAGTAVHVSVAPVDGHAVVEVADEGPGLDPDIAEKVFERFYRTDTARSRAHGGTGLGLSIVAAVAEAHGGRASVTTAPGHGARFRVELPLPGPTNGHAGPNGAVETARPDGVSARDTTGGAPLLPAYVEDE